MGKFAKITYSILVIFGIFTYLRYGAWWFQSSHIPHNWHNTPFHYFDLLIFGVLSFVVFFTSFLKIGTWFAMWHMKRPRPMSPEKNLRVAFLTCYVPGSEPIEMLETTLIAMLAVEYKHDTWVLDEGNSEEVRAVCSKLGVFHFSRYNIAHFNQDSGHFRSKTKGGNLNAWRHEHENAYDIVAQVDMDHIPHRDYLTEQLGYFLDPKVGYVVVPQIYKNTHNWIARGAAEQTHFYYGPLQQGFYGANMPFLIGTTHVYRVSAMRDFGGYAPSIAEDYLTSMHFSSRGWKGVYVPKILAEGEGPTSWTDYYNQQMRWSYGLYEILFKHTRNHIFSLTNKQKLNLFFSQLFYFSGLVTAFGFILVSLYLIFGINSTNMRLQDWIVYSAPAYISGMVIHLFVHRYYIEPKSEPKFGIYGILLALAASIIYVVALFRFLTKKGLTYKVTAKGNSANNNISIAVISTHLLMLLISLLTLELSLFTDNNSLVMRFWAILNVSLLSFLALAVFWEQISKFANNIFNHYKIFEYVAENEGPLPTAPSAKEKYRYIKDHRKTFLLFSTASFVTLQVSMFKFITNNVVLWPLLAYFIFSIIYFFVSLFVNINSRGFDIKKHNRLVKKWSDLIDSDVDVFLPTAGESIDVLTNTWNGVLELKRNFKGNLIPYCLDDGDRPEVKKLAEEFGFKYIVRPNRGWYKKAGNLRHGFEVTKNEFIVIFDADFIPRNDFLNEVLPYMYEHPTLGLVQSPQYFDVHQSQNWLQRGAGAVQEWFYRFCQVSRQSNNSSICVGSNAIYRRAALNSIGGTALIEHSEDVHTGFELRTQGWGIQYIPIILAKGLCPSEMQAFFKQQYRWCLGSMSLLFSENFWRTKMTFMARLSYFSGFLYYMHTAISSFIAPVIPLAIIILYPNQISLENYLLVLPSLLFVQLIYPMWHKSTYGIEAWATRSVYGWAHLFAIIDSVTGKHMSWQATGSKMSANNRFTYFRLLQFCFNFIPALVWVLLSSFHLISRQEILFAPLIYGGIYYLLICSKVTFYQDRTVRFAKSISISAFIVVLIVLAIEVGAFYKLAPKDTSTLKSKEQGLTGSSAVMRYFSSLNKDSDSNISSRNYTETALPGDSVTKMVRRMIESYSEENNIKLSVSERTIAEVSLVNKLPRKPLIVGDQISVSKNEVENSVNTAKQQ